MAIPVTQHALAVAQAPGTVGKLELCFLAIFQQCDVAEKEMLALVTAKVCTAGLFGHIAKEEDGVIAFLKATCNVDVDARAEYWVIRSQLLMAWETCWNRGQIEIKEAAERAVNKLPPQCSAGEYERTKAAFDTIDKVELEEYLTRSESYFERKIGLVQTIFKAEPLTEVANKVLARSSRERTEHYARPRLRRKRSGHLQVEEAGLRRQSPRHSGGLQT